MKNGPPPKVVEHSLFLVFMTEGIFNRMVKQGAIVIKDGDCVQITDRANLLPNK